MRKELKRCNFLGNAPSLHYLVDVAVVDYSTDIESVKSICALNNSLNLNSIASIYFLEELGIITIDAAKKIIATEFGMSFRACDSEKFIIKLSEAVYLYLIENGLIILDAISYDPATKLCHIRRSGFPLNAAVFRNLLIEFGALLEISTGEYQVNELYESLFETSIKKQRPKLTLEDLLEKQRKQEEQGRKAEEFVVSFEKARLAKPLSESVKQISDIDVAAGYDVLSYDSDASKRHDRFIEVKSYHNIPQFFWSSNEYETAKKIGDKYWLYLVDMEQYLTPGYSPITISNPATIFDCTEDWIIEVASWKITKI